MPTSKARSGIFSIIMLRLQPVGMAGVMPSILGLRSASSTMVWPKTSWNLGGRGPADALASRLPVTTSKRSPTACHAVWFSSAGVNPLPLTVMGPRMRLRSRRTEAR